MLVSDGILENSQRRTPHIREAIRKIFAKDPYSNAAVAIDWAIKSSKSSRQPDITRKYVDDFAPLFTAWQDSQIGKPIEKITTFSEFLQTHPGGGEYLIANAHVARGLAAIDSQAYEIHLPGEPLEHGQLHGH